MPLVTSEFKASKKLYAIDRSSFSITETTTHLPDGTDIQTYRYDIEAVWFRKRSNGRLAAFKGTLWDISSDKDQKRTNPLSLEDFISTISTARYGGNPYGCWDGQGTWWNGNYSSYLALQQSILPTLQDMLANHPAIPAGYDGWYALVD